MLDETYISTLKDEYLNNISDYHSFLEVINSALKKYIKDENIEYNLMESRVKSFDSILRKIERKKNKYVDPFKEITDLLGIRIVTYYREDVDLITKLLFENFNIDYENSVNKLVNMDSDRMGYLSVHYVCTLKTNDLNPKGKKLNNLDFKFEIQIRTALQHAWAAIDHKLRYKTLVKLPKKIERKLFRVSALLEIADSEFSKIKDEIGNIEQFYKNKISTENYHVRLDLSTIAFYLNFNDKLVLKTIQPLEVFHYNAFDIAKEEKLEKVLLNYALKFDLNKVEDINDILLLIKSNKRIFTEFLDTALKEKLRYLINSACSFFITTLLILFEEPEELKKVYKLSDESLSNIIIIRKELLIKNEK